jgi:hypothetical protein
VRNILVAIHDVDKFIKVDVNPSELKKLNSDGYGIFVTVNRFKYKRGKDDLERLDYFYADFDGGDKEKHIEILKKCPMPSLLVETKNGFHVYWKIADDMVSLYGKEKAAEYYTFIQKLIINCTGADESGQDVSKILRVPGYLHQKNPSDPFMIKIAFKSDVTVKHGHMFSFFKSGYQKDEGVKSVSNFSNSLGITLMGETFISIWEKVSSENQMFLLEKISGHAMVGGETYTFTPMRTDGKHFIRVNGKTISGAWIDSKGMIGSHQKGGPTVVQWLEYFGHSKKDIAKFLEEIL